MSLPKISQSSLRIYKYRKCLADILVSGYEYGQDEAYSVTKVYYKHRQW